MFEFQISCRAVFGAGCVDSLGDQVCSLPGEPPQSFLLVLCVNSEWCRDTEKRVRSSLVRSCGEHTRVEVFDRVVENPTLDCVREGAALCSQTGAGGIVSLGGGSVLDAGKAIAAEAGTGLLVNIPTTAGSGSEVSPWAVITDPRTRSKLSMQAAMPDLALLDSQLTMTMGPGLTLFSGIDAFAHAVEGYLSRTANRVTDALALAAIELIQQNLPVCISSPRDLHARTGMLEASFLAGAAMMHSGLGLAHAVANTVGGWYHEAAHGMVIGHLLEEVVRFNSTVCRARCDRISEAVHSTGELFRSECARLGLRPLTLAAGDLPRLVSRSSSNLNAKTNPRDFTEADVKGLLHACFAVQD